ncbi:hypothetical protein F4801DRAFT_112902 [Xylaria longipes]|nr:hypothetical protein F4801DRAFT_112902 [Xylaria longipes]
MNWKRSAKSYIHTVSACIHRILTGSVASLIAPSLVFASSALSHALFLFKLEILTTTLRAVRCVPNFAFSAAVAFAARPDQLLRKSSSAFGQCFANRGGLSLGILVRILFLVRCVPNLALSAAVTAAVSSCRRPGHLRRKSSSALDQGFWRTSRRCLSLEVLASTLLLVRCVPNFAFSAAVASGREPDQFLRKSSSASESYLHLLPLKVRRKGR